MFFYTHTSQQSSDDVVDKPNLLSQIFILIYELNRFSLKVFEL